MSPLLSSLVLEFTSLWSIKQWSRLITLTAVGDKPQLKCELIFYISSNDPFPRRFVLNQYLHFAVLEERQFEELFCCFGDKDVDLSHHKPASLTKKTMEAEAPRINGQTMNYRLKRFPHSLRCEVTFVITCAKRIHSPTHTPHLEEMCGRPAAKQLSSFMSAFNVCSVWVYQPLDKWTQKKAPTAITVQA